jgi:hypothetical protein
MVVAFVPFMAFQFEMVQATDWLWIWQSTPFAVRIAGIITLFSLFAAAAYFLFRRK